jgi:hypothetical protein
MTYSTSISSINFSPEDTLGTLTADEVVTLLVEIQKAMTLQYYTKAKKIERVGTRTEGDSWKYAVVHRDGEYGVYKLGTTQLIDAGIVGDGLTSWINNTLPSVPVSAQGQEQFTSWYSLYLNIANEKVTVIESPTSVRNNALFYMLTHVLVGNPRFTPSVTTELGGITMESFLLDPKLQDAAAVKLMQFTYDLLLTSRLINATIDAKTLGGILSLAICFNIDAAQNYLRGTIKSDEDGISSKYWFDVGYNAIASLSEKVPTPGPNQTTSVVRDADVVQPTQPTSAPGSITRETQIKTTPSGERVERTFKLTKTISNGTIIYELTSSGTVSAKVVSGTASENRVVSSRAPSNPFEIQRNGIRIRFRYDLGGSYNLQILDVVNNNRVVLTSTGNDIVSLRSNTLTRLRSLLRRVNFNGGGRSIVEYGLAINGIIRWVTNDLPSIADSLKNVAEAVKGNTKLRSQSNQLLAFDNPADIETLVKQLENKKSEAKDAGLDFIMQVCDTAKSDILTNFGKDTSELVTEINQSSNTSETGSSTTTVTTTLESGAVSTVTSTTDEDGIVSQQRTIDPVQPPLRDPPPSTIDNGIDHNLRSAESLNTVNTSPEANQIPSNENTSVASPPDRGYADPNGRYPKADYANKPDTNTLALGVNSPNINPDPRTFAGDRESQSLGSSPAARNASRKRGVKAAGRSGATWEQPATPYNARYPYNKVFAGESGHALEIDDTPGFERLNIAHRSGTFTETGPDGTQVNKIVGNGYSIIEKDGFVLIEGTANVHVAGQCNVFIMNDTTLSMHGKVSLDIHNDVNVNIGGSLGISVQEGIYVRNEGDMSLQNKGNINSDVAGASSSKVVGKYNLITDAGLNLTSKVNTNIKSAGAYYNHSTGDMNFCTDSALKARSTGDMSVKTDGVMKQESAGDFNVKSGGTLNEESAGNISLKAPLVTSSPIDTATLDVTTANITTLNAGTTNLRATGTDTGTNGGSTHDLPISGPTSASVTAPAAAVAAEDADCAKAATPPITNTLEPPVSASSPQPIERSNDEVKTGYDGENDAMNSDGGDVDSSGTRIQVPAGDCVTSDADPSSSGNSPTETNDTGDPSSSSGVIPPDGGRAPRQCNTVTYASGRTVQLPPLPGPGERFNGNLQMSPNFKLDDLCLKGSNGAPLGWEGLQTSVHGHSVPVILANLRCLAVNLLEPIREKYGRFTLTCAYRYRHPTRGGKDPGAHGYGAAADIQLNIPKRQYVAAAQWMATNLRHDQILLEGRGSRSVWIHVGWVYKDGSQRAGNSDGTMYNDKFMRGGQGRFIATPNM